MESLIRIQYLFDTLQRGEQIQVMNRITVACGTKWIMKLIFKHFAEKLQSDSADKTTIAAIIKAISSVIIDREPKAQRHANAAPVNDELESSDTEEGPLVIEDIPSVMISKIGSYLNQNDYIHFMHTSRRILIGCHSPFSLYHLNVNDGNHTERGIKSVGSTRSLTLHYGEADTVNTVISLPTNSNIERFTMIQRRRGLVIQSNQFLNIIQCFPNIKCLDAPSHIQLCDLRTKSQDIDDIPPPTMRNLKGTVFHFGNGPFARFQRSLIRKHALQIESLKLALDYGWKLAPPNPALCNLTELKMENHWSAFHGYDPTCFEWIKQSSKLRIFSMDCFRSYLNNYGTQFVEEVITVLIENQSDLQFMEFVYNAYEGNVMELLQQIGNGLSTSNWRMNESTEFKVRIQLKGEWIDSEQRLKREATKVLVKILRDHDKLTRFKLIRKFNSSQSSSWSQGFTQKLGNFRSFVRNHERFRILDDEGERTFSVALIRSSTDEPNAMQKQAGRNKAEMIIDGLGRLVEILEECNVRNFMVQIIVRLTAFMRYSRQQKVEEMEDGLDDLVQKWKEKYRVDTFYESEGELESDRWRITFCNKDNQMKDGYGVHGLFID